MKETPLGGLVRVSTSNLSTDSSQIREPGKKRVGGGPCNHKRSDFNVRRLSLQLCLYWCPALDPYSGFRFNMSATAATAANINI